MVLIKNSGKCFYVISNMISPCSFVSNFSPFFYTFVSTLLITKAFCKPKGFVRFSLNFPFLKPTSLQVLFHNATSCYAATYFAQKLLLERSYLVESPKLMWIFIGLFQAFFVFLGSKIYSYSRNLVNITELQYMKCMKVNN